MEDIRFRYYNPVIGNPSSVDVNKTNNNSKTQSSVDFGEILQQQIEKTESVNFSKHATERVKERNIDISEANLVRLNEGIKIASEKNLNDALILVDQTAFIVNVPTNTVITTKDNEEGNVFTNINGTVIM
ncbi:MAG: TIGR02530 family flagellar biosynthesis protein [Clostridia bacterium]